MCLDCLLLTFLSFNVVETVEVSLAEQLLSSESADEVTVMVIVPVVGVVAVELERFRIFCELLKTGS